MKKYIVFLFIQLLAILPLMAQQSTGFYYRKPYKSSEVRYSSKGTSIFISKGRKIVVLPRNSQTVTKVIKIGQKVESFVLSPTDKYLLAINNRNKLVCKQALSDSIFKSSIKVSGNILSFDFLNDSTAVLLTDRGSLKIISLVKGEIIDDIILSKLPVRAMAIERSTEMVAVCGKDSTVLLYDVKAKQIRRLPTSVKWSRAIAFSYDGQKLALGSDDKRVRIIDLKTGALILQHSVNRDWIKKVAFTADDNFVASIDDKKVFVMYDLKKNNLAFKEKFRKKEMKFFELEPTGRDFLVYNKHSKKVKEMSIKNLNINPIQKFKDLKDKTPPQLHVSNPPNFIDGTAIVYDQLVKLEGTVLDESGVRDIKINGSGVKLKDNGNFTMFMPLALGENTVVLEAVDVNDNVARKKIILNRKNTSGDVVDYESSKNYLLVIGANDYQKWPKLVNAVGDATRLYNTLTSEYDFEPENAVLLIDSMASRERIETELKSLISKVTSNDNLLIYYAGHGYFDPILNEGYWVPVEATSESQYIPNSRLLKFISNMNTRHTFLVVDACFSGSLFASRTRGYTENVEKFRSRWGLASGRLETVSDGAYGENSPFASSFIGYLEKSQKDKIPVSEVVQHVKMEVSEVAKQTPIGNALRDVGDEGGEFVFKKRNK